MISDVCQGCTIISFMLGSVNSQVSPVLSTLCQSERRSTMLQLQISSFPRNLFWAFLSTNHGEELH